MLSDEEINDQLDKLRTQLSDAGERWCDARAAGKSTSSIDAEITGYEASIRRLERQLSRKERHT